MSKNNNRDDSPPPPPPSTLPPGKKKKKRKCFENRQQLSGVRNEIKAFRNITRKIDR
jgi:hypothetical protein